MSAENDNRQIVPFLKWAGGKRWFLQHACDLVPEFSGTYFEPFLGSGAMFFYLKPRRAVLADCNSELIETYVALKNDWGRVVEKLLQHHKRHCKPYYYQVRDSRPRLLHTRAARFIYLNRTCWNGLYRVNRKGQFNVPIGTKNNVLLQTDCFETISNTLQNADLISSDFEVVIDCAEAGDFVFVDPPYTVRHNHNGFVKYNEKLFSWQDQERLKACIDRAVARGAKVLVTNADHESVRELYRDYEQIQISRPSRLAANSDFRGRYDELVILCGHGEWSNAQHSPVFIRQASAAS